MKRLGSVVPGIVAVWIAAGAIAEDRPLRETIDAEVSAAWEKQQIKPAAASIDPEFLRRVYLDLVGVIPTYDETVAFLADTATDKRTRLIDKLLEDPRYAQHQADLWDLILFGRNPPGYNTDRRDGIQRWLREQFAANRPYDEWVRDLLKAEGNSVEQGPPLYFAQYRNQPEDLNEVVTQTFLGVQLQCARCHDHPFEPWKQVEFYGMAAFFARLQVVDLGEKDKLPLMAIGEKSTGDVLFTGPAKDQQPGKKGNPVKPKFLLGEELVEPPLPEGFKEPERKGKEPPQPPVFSRKDQLADWITKTDNPFFARAIANRVWAQYLGRGIVHPVDNMSPSNEASHPQLLESLTKWLVEHKFDLKAYTRELVNSRPYQLSSFGSLHAPREDGISRSEMPTMEPFPLWFQHARTRPLSAEELAESWRVATGYSVWEASREEKKKEGRYRPLDGYMLHFFGQPNNGTGDFQGGVAEHLYLNNGPLGNLIVSGPGTLMESLTNKETAVEERIDRLFLQMLNRPPSAEERTKLAELISADNQPEDRWRDAVWALMTCSEFRFNH
jgi:hypothetical protein